MIDKTITVTTEELSQLRVKPGEHISLRTLPQNKQEAFAKTLKLVEQGKKTELTPGGSALNVCRVAAWCGARASFIGAVGDDMNGR